MIIRESTLRMGYITGRFAWDSGSLPALAPAGALAGDEAVWNGSTNQPKQRSSRRVNFANQSFSSTAYANVSDLIVPINRGGVHTFEYFLLYESSATTEGAGFRIAFTGISNVDYALNMFTDQSNQAPIVVSNAFSTTLPPQASGPGPATGGGAGGPMGGVTIAYIMGSLNVTTVGDLSVQARAESGGANSVTVRIGSWCRVYAE